MAMAAANTVSVSVIMHAACVIRERVSICWIVSNWLGGSSIWTNHSELLVVTVFIVIFVVVLLLAAG